ncbi:MAG: hypothetical protein AB1815_06445 [Bacillota bacterium]
MREGIDLGHFTVECCVSAFISNSKEPAELVNITGIGQGCRVLFLISPVFLFIAFLAGIRI